MKKITLSLLLLSIANISASEQVPQEAELTKQQKANLKLVRGVRRKNKQMIDESLKEGADIHVEIETHTVIRRTPEEIERGQSPTYLMKSLLAYAVDTVFDAVDLDLIMKIAAEVQIPEHFTEAIQAANNARYAKEDDALFSDVEKSLHRLRCEKAQNRHRKSFYVKESK